MAEPSPAAPGLPDEMMTEVFLRLPVKSILRFRAVCRSWAAALSSEEFCSLHAAKMAEAESVSPKLFSLSPTPGFDSTGLYSCSSSTTSGSLLLALDDVRGDFADMTLAPCRGLNLLRDAVAPAYYVFSAATRAVTRLPRYQDSSFASAGLGFDARTKEYKVVRLFHQAIARGYYKIKCEVYVLGADRWRPSPAPGVPFTTGMAAISAATELGFKLQPVFADGFLHWLLDPAELPTTQKASVLSFSVTEETFTLVRSPPFELEIAGVHLVELDDHLCMVRDLRPHGGTVLEIWKMKDFSITGDWSLEQSINLSQHVGTSLIEPQVIRVVGSLGNCGSRKKVILVTSKRKVITYDPLSQTTQETSLAIKETHSSYETEKSIPRVSIFRERLALVKKTKEEIFSSSPMGMATKEILLRISGDYAVQCKLVSKQWHGLIEGQSFVRSYRLRNNMDGRPKIMLVGKSAGGLGFSVAPLQKLLQQAPSHGSTWLETKVVCSKPCHGMNLISNYKEDHLYNPCTGYRRIFPSRFRALHATSSL